MEVSTIVLCPPMDMIYEILLHCCSIKEVDKCKSVSKEFQEIIYDQNFMSKYYEREDNVYGYLVQSLFRNYHSHEFVSINKSDRKFAFTHKNSNTLHRFDDVQIKASSLQGILCCLTQYHRKYRFYVCKPTTGQWQHLPSPKFRYFGRHVGMAVLGSKPLHFVIIRLSYPKAMSNQGYNYICELFDSKAWRWKQTEDLVLPNGSCIVGWSMYASGLICWLTSDNNIIAFSPDGETRYEYQLPEISHVFCIKEIVEYQGKIGLICQEFQEKYVELWLLKDRKRCCSWEKIISIELESSLAGNVRLCGFYSSEVALASELYGVLFYKLKERRYKKVKIKDAAPKFFIFRSDFETVHLKGAWNGR